MDYQQIITEKVTEVRERIRAAAQQAHRDSESVSMVAVTKYAAVESELIPALLKAGCSDFGESRPQLLEEKACFYQDHPSVLSGNAIRWHQIGPLQRNKIRRILPYVELIHSIDSLKLLEAVDRIAGELQDEGKLIIPPCSVLLEVHLSNDATKQGFLPDELRSALPKIPTFSRLKVRGLMGMGGLDASEDELHRQFESLRLLSEELCQNHEFFADARELSMGMSQDFELAIAHGATIVRIGSILYPSTL